MTKHLAETSATAEKTLDDIISHPTFGNLAKLTVLVILIAGFAVSGAVVIIRGGDPNAYIEGAKTLGIFALSALAGGITTTVGKSETAKTILAQTEAVSTDQGQVRALPADSEALHGNYTNNGPAEDTSPAVVGAEPTEVTSTEADTEFVDASR